MGKFFWPVYIAVASVSGALAWRFAPAVGRSLSPELRRAICSAVDSTTALFSKGEAPAGNDGAPCVAVGDGDGNGTANAAAVSAPPPAPTAREEELSAKRRGVLPVDAIHARWGVLTRATPVEDLDGAVVGKLPGGRFLTIKKTIMTPSGPMAVGRFVQQKRPGDVRVPIGNINCLSGAPSFLSTNQQTCLRKYYELTGEAEELKKKLMIEAARGSPYQKAAADALGELHAKEKAAEKLKAADFDTRRKASYEISQLRVRFQELNQKHRAWKTEHAAELPDPEKDPAYLELLSQRKRYEEPIGDLLF